MKLFLLAVLILSPVFGVDSWAQSPGKATSSGICSVAHNGNNDTITIQNCGIGQEQADKIISILKSVLANQQFDSRDAKLNEILELLKHTANPYGTIITYEPSGYRRKLTPSTGSTVVDSVANATYTTMVEEESTHSWQSLLATADQATAQFQGWFTPHAFIGSAQFHLCQRDAARQSLKLFVNETEGAVTYTPMRNTSQQMLALLDSPQYLQDCHIVNSDKH